MLKYTNLCSIDGSKILQQRKLCLNDLDQWIDVMFGMYAFTLDCSRSQKF